jgi:hypothetical protein
VKINLLEEARQSIKWWRGLKLILQISKQQRINRTLSPNNEEGGRASERVMLITLFLSFSQGRRRRRRGDFKRLVRWEVLWLPYCV